MPSIDSIAEALFGSKRAETQEVLTDATTRTYVGTAVSDSEDGTVRVDLGGDVTLPDDIEGVAEYDASGIEVATGPNVRVGDEVVVTVFGGSTLKTPMVTGVMGSGDRQEAGIETAQSRADDAWDYADSASDAAADAWSHADDAKDAADAAQASADTASEAAARAIGDAAEAALAAYNAQQSADTAANAAGRAQESADEAEQHAQEALGSAQTANTAASDALTQLSVVEDVIGTVNWVAEHGTYVPTTDVTVDPDKVYFSRTGSGTHEDPYVYVPVSSPEQSQLSTYYELDIDTALSQYVASHLALTDAGLWVLRDESSYKTLLSDRGTSVVDPYGHTVVTYGPSTVFAADREWMIGSEAAYIYYDGAGHLYIGGASVTFGPADGVPIQELIDATNGWSYDHNFTLEAVSGTRDATARQYVFTATVTRGGRNVTSEVDPEFFVWYLRDDENGDRLLDGTAISGVTYSVSGPSLTITQASAGYRSTIVGGLQDSADFALVDDSGNSIVSDGGDTIIGHAIGDWSL